MTAPGQHSGRVVPNVAFSPLSAPKEGRSANDSHGQLSSRKVRRRITKAEAAAIGERLSNRERACLDDVARLGTATGRQLERLHYDPSESGRRIARLELGRLADLGVLQRLTRRIGGVRGGSRGFVYALGVTGQRILYPGRSRYREPWTPQPSYLRHALNVTDLYVRLRETEGTGSFELVAYDGEPRCWRSFSGPGGAMATLKPDAYAVLYQGDFEDRFFIEVDLGTEDGPRILAKAHTYLNYWRSGKEQESTGIFPLVCWVTDTEQRREFLARIFEQLSEGEQALFTVTTRDDFINHITNNNHAAVPIVLIGQDGQPDPPKEVNQ
jgi:hypothetical protein